MDGVNWQAGLAGEDFGARGVSAGDASADLTMAFQPILDVNVGRVFAFEALVRGRGGAPAASVLAAIGDADRAVFDRRCRVRAIELAAELGVAAQGASVSINTLPDAIEAPEPGLAATIEAAERVGFPQERIIFEFGETQALRDPQRAAETIHRHRELGFRTAIDDFGSAGLDHLADIAPDLIKLDMQLVRGLSADAARRAAVRYILEACRGHGIDVIAAGVETAAEHRALEDLGIALFQGYHFARPGYERLPSVRLSL